eukprot:6418392-Amphidinium_carterae.1
MPGLSPANGKGVEEVSLPSLEEQECRPLKEHFALRTAPAVAEPHPEDEPQDWLQSRIWGQPSFFKCYFPAHKLFMKRNTLLARLKINLHFQFFPHRFGGLFRGVFGTSWNILVRRTLQSGVGNSTADKDTKRIPVQEWGQAKQNVLLLIWVSVALLNAPGPTLLNV